jgi:hypothetical protein
MRRALAMIALGVLACAVGAGCGAPEVRTAQGRAVYRTQKDGRPVVVAVATQERRVAQVDVADERGPQAGRSEPAPVDTRIEESELATLVARLDALGLFALPGRPSVPDLPGPRSITVDTTARKFYVAITDLRDNAQGDVYGKAAKAILETSLKGGIHIGEGELKAH